MNPALLPGNVSLNVVGARLSEPLRDGQAAAARRAARRKQARWVTSWLVFLAILLSFLAAPNEAQAQRRRGGYYYSNAPEWPIEPSFKNDTFVFARVRYSSGRGRFGYGGRGGWDTDWPDAEWNLATRLKQMTSLNVEPEGVIIDLTDPELYNYPFIYIVEPGGLVFQSDEVPALRKYLLNGGFLMVDDFWGEREWYNFADQLKRVFPDREPQEIPLEHEIFHIVFDLKEKPQIPNVQTGTESEITGITWERPDARTPFFKALYDDKGRMMVIICHNTDLGDGWEREGENIYYFREFSEKKAFPLGINIIFYAMTH